MKTDYPIDLPPTRPHRTVWWVDILFTLLILGLTPGVFWLAGGTADDLARPLGDHLDKPAAPVLAAALVFVALGLVYHLADYQARRTERDLIAWDRYLQTRHTRGAARQLPRRSGEATANTTRPGSSDAVLEQLVRMCGPIGFTEMHEKLKAGGPWGPPVPISAVAMGKLLRKDDGKELKDWLVPRSQGDPYIHVDSVRDREAAHSE